jgi:DNA-binding CsgD family transcriptional regulator
MPSEAAVLRLIGGIYEAAAEPSQWNPLLEALAEALGGTLTAILMHDPATNEGRPLWVARGDPDYQRLYDDHYHAKNVYVTSRPDAIQVGRVLTGQELCPERDVLRSEIHADWMSPQDIFWTAGSPVLQEDSAFAIVTSMRPHRAPPFGRDEVLLLETLVPHFQRALQVQRRLWDLRQARDTAAGALDRLPVGVMLLDERGRPFVINARAREILDQGDGLAIGAQGVEAASSLETASLQAAIRGAARTAAGCGLESGGALPITRPSGRRPLAALVAPLTRRRADVWGGPVCVALFVSDPEHSPETTAEAAARLYGLSAAERRLLALLVEGETPAGAADRLALSAHTVRTQLKAIFTRTGTCRQSELLRVVLGGPAALE